MFADVRDPSRANWLFLSRRRCQLALGIFSSPKKVVNEEAIIFCFFGGIPLPPGPSGLIWRARDGERKKNWTRKTTEFSFFFILDVSLKVGFSQAKNVHGAAECIILEEKYELYLVRQYLLFSGKKNERVTGWKYSGNKMMPWGLSDMGALRKKSVLLPRTNEHNGS